MKTLAELGGPRRTSKAGLLFTGVLFTEKSKRNPPHAPPPCIYCFTACLLKAKWAGFIQRPRRHCENPKHSTLTLSGPMVSSGGSAFHGCWRKGMVTCRSVNRATCLTRDSDFMSSGAARLTVPAGEGRLPPSVLLFKVSSRIMRVFFPCPLEGLSVTHQAARGIIKLKRRGFKRLRSIPRCRRTS